MTAAAARDLARFSKTPERAENALADLNALIAKSHKGSTVYHGASLAKARVLARLGRKAEAQAIFRQAIAERWDKNAFKYFYESLRGTSSSFF